MKFAKLLTAVLALALAGSYTLAQEKETGTKESLEKKAGEKSGKEGEKAKKFDRGDAKAEKILKKAYIRVQSAESDGLRKLVADATVDVAVMRQVMKVEGSLLWKSGKGLLFDIDEDEAGGMSSMVSGEVKKRFQPFMRFALGFEFWDVKFKEASFSFAETEKKKDGKKKADVKKKEDGKIIVVKFKSKTTTSETYVVKKNKVTAVRTTDGPDSKNLIVYKFEYSDKGKSLSIKKIETTAELEGVPMPELPDDPKNPVPKEKEKTDEKPSLAGSVEFTEYGKAGKFKICTEMVINMKLTFWGQEIEIPATLTIENARANDKVKDEELKPLEGDSPDGEEKDPDDDEF